MAERRASAGEDSPAIASGRASRDAVGVNLGVALTSLEGLAGGELAADLSIGVLGGVNVDVEAVLLERRHFC